jgi:hypothetical protein
MVIYIVEETTWDHHENVAVFDSRITAEDFCNTHYGAQHADDYWAHKGYGYSIVDYVVNAVPTS